jgi:hypothetical protein
MERHGSLDGHHPGIGVTASTSLDPAIFPLGYTHSLRRSRRFWLRSLTVNFTKLVL